MLFSRCNSLSYLKDRRCERWAAGRGEASKMAKEGGAPPSECTMSVLLSSTLQLANLCCYIPRASPWGPWARWRESARQSAFMNRRRAEGRSSEQSRLCQGAPPRAGGSREQIAKAVTSALSYELTAADTVFWGVGQELEPVEESDPHLHAGRQSDSPVQHPSARGQRGARASRRSWSEQDNAALGWDVPPLQAARRVPWGHHPAAIWLLLRSQPCGTVKIFNRKNTCLLVPHAHICRQCLDNQFRDNNSSLF